MYMRVMNIYHWCHTAYAMNLSYNDAGVFYLHAAAPPAQVGQLQNILTDQLVYATMDISSEELARSQKQLNASLLMNLESKSLAAEDMGRQVLGIGKRMEADELMAYVNDVTIDDLHRVARKMLLSKPTLVGYGNQRHEPSYELLEENCKRWSQ